MPGPRGRWASPSGPATRAHRGKSLSRPFERMLRRRWLTEQRRLVELRQAKQAAEIKRSRHLDRVRPASDQAREEARAERERNRTG